MKKNIINISSSYILSFMLLAGALSCSKRDEFLNEKPRAALSTITSLEDAEKLLGSEDLFNLYADPEIGALSSDDYYINDAAWLSLPQEEQNLYVWNKEIWPVNKNVPDWSKPYNQIFVCNVVLDALEDMKISPSEQTKMASIKGTALFYRSYAFYNILQTFTLPYKISTAENTLGIPMRLNSDLNQKSTRSNQKQCLDIIIKDTQLSASMLPTNSSRLTAPTKQAAYGLLSRIYIAISDFENCKLYSDSCLNINSTITDYNKIESDEFNFTNPANPYPSEDIFHSTMGGYTALSFSTAIVDSVLYSSYEDSDLRKTFFFTTYADAIRFKGSYEFHRFGAIYTGITTAEILLNRAECYARRGSIADALKDLNKLLEKRYKTGEFVPRTASTSDESLNIILDERRKELCFRGLRWTDIRRLNNEQRYAKSLTRMLNGVTYTLPPNDPKYALPIPDIEIQLSAMEQNPR